MQQNYKSLAAAAIAALFACGIVSETSGMVDPASASQITTKAEALFEQFKSAVESKDFPVALGLGRAFVRNFYMGTDYPSCKRSEMDDIIIAAVEADSNAHILSDLISLERQLLLKLDNPYLDPYSGKLNYAMSYEVCDHILFEISKTFHPSPDYPKDEIALKNVQPKTANGQMLKNDLLRSINAEKGARFQSDL